MPSPLRANSFHNFSGLGSGCTLVLWCVSCNHGMTFVLYTPLYLHTCIISPFVAAQPQQRLSSRGVTCAKQPACAASRSQTQHATLSPKGLPQVAQNVP